MSNPIHYNILRLRIYLHVPNILAEQTTKCINIIENCSGHLPEISVAIWFSKIEI